VTEGDTRDTRGHRGLKGHKPDNGETRAETSLLKTKRKIYKTKTG